MLWGSPFLGPTVYNRECAAEGMQMIPLHMPWQCLRATSRAACGEGGRRRRALPQRSEVHTVTVTIALCRTMAFLEMLCTAVRATTMSCLAA